MSAPVCASRHVQPAQAASSGSPAPAAWLDRAYAIKTRDPDGFRHLLNQLHGMKDTLSDSQQRELQYLDAWLLAYQGNYSRANRLLHDIIAHVGDAPVSARASALLVYTLSSQHHYDKAYRRASRLLSSLPKISDHRTRLAVLHQISQMLASAGQFKLALKYARQYESELPAGANPCKAKMLEINARVGAKTLDVDSPAWQEAIDSCRKAGDVVFSNAIRLERIGTMIEAGRAQEAMPMLQQLAPVVRRAGFQRHRVNLDALLAQAYLQDKDYRNARRYALATVHARHADSFAWALRTANHILYQVEKQTGHRANALGYYETYVALQKSSTDDAKARAMAYQMARQEVLSKKLKLEALSRQNRILQLRQSLDRKSAETSRLYIVLLLTMLVFLGFLAYRFKHSQIRFRRMARHDDLTGILNRQYFFEQTENILRRLHKAGEHACLVILDMDHFKRINDAYGHVSGDAVLQHVTRTCSGELRESDVFGRLGGEEFGILMPGCTIDQGRDIAERIRQALARSPVPTPELASVTATASIGLAGTETTGHSLKPLLVAADEALYTAKRCGRNQLAIQAGRPGKADA